MHLANVGGGGGTLSLRVSRYDPVLSHIFGTWTIFLPPKMWHFLSFCSDLVGSHFEAPHFQHVDDLLPPKIDQIYHFIQTLFWVPFWTSSGAPLLFLTPRTPPPPRIAPILTWMLSAAGVHSTYNLVPSTAVTEVIMGAFGTENNKKINYPYNPTKFENFMKNKMASSDWGSEHFSGISLQLLDWRMIFNNNNKNSP